MAKKKSLPKKRLTPPEPATDLVEPEAESSAESPIPARANDEFPIVGIGASAGGLSAFEAFLSAMPFVTEKGIAIVLVQHLSPDHKSLLSELVKRYTRMQVHEVADGMEVKPNRVYIIPPNRDMALLGGKLHLLVPTAARGVRLSIDYFFRSLAAERREHAICIVLSGTGSDGAQGVRAVKGEGGMAMAQTPETTEFDGMPRSAIATGMVDYVLPPAQMPARLIAYVNQLFRRQPSDRPAPAQASDSLAKICILLRAKTGHDFSQYKESTVRRRVQRRMALQQVEHFNDYLHYMQNNPEEIEGLFRDLLIGVTHFFRDKDAFDALTAAIPKLFQDLPRDGAVRAWVCGCSTGEEAYSLAILIQEYMETLDQKFKVQIFATDIDRTATDQARAGTYPPSISADVSPERLARYFTQDSNGSYYAKKVIRDSLIFSEQDVLRDPPFSRLGLVSCRNLLIYLNSDLQKRLMSLFHYALIPGGLLFLGNSETIGDQRRLFETLDRKMKLYSRNAEEQSGPRLSMREVLGQDRDPVNAANVAAEAASEVKLNLRELTEQTLLRHCVPAAVLIREDGEILYFHGRTGNYLEPSPGQAGSNVLAMAREGLRGELTVALGRARLQKVPLHSNNLQVNVNGHHITVNLTILTVGASAAQIMLHLFLVIFEEKAAVESLPDVKPSGTAEIEGAIAALEQELRAKDEYLQTIIEEMDTSGEELKSSNEEMQSVNEEMQSTNEELETSKEELQSVNEELATVNAELQQRVTDLSRANNDMNNLLAGTGVGTLFVDHELRIARFTPSITKVINLIPTDVGRPLAHVVSNLIGYEHLVADVQGVLDTLIPVEQEAEMKAGGWYLLGIRPYRTLDNIIEGVVVTSVDITDRKVAEQKVKEAERFRLASEIETVGIVFFKVDGAITSANDAFLRMSGYNRPYLEAGRLHWDALTVSGDTQQFLKSLEELRTSGHAIPYEREYLRNDGSSRLALFTARRTGEGEAVGYIIDVPAGGSSLARAAAKP